MVCAVNGPAVGLKQDVWKRKHPWKCCQLCLMLCHSDVDFFTFPKTGKEKKMRHFNINSQTDFQ